MKLALIGDPVEHSRSPEIQQRLLSEAGIAGSYDLIRVERGHSFEAIAALRTAAYNGCNVTSPLKEEVIAACGLLSPGALRAEAVNTIALRGQVVGTSTDGIGAARALTSFLTSLEGRQIAVLGTGPTARSVIGALQEEGATVCTWGRDANKVAGICSRFGISPWASEFATQDAIVSALLPSAVLPARIVEAVSQTAVVMDANYGERSTLATQLGVAVIDGSRMLEEQARASFGFWLQTE